MIPDWDLTLKTMRKTSKAKTEDVCLHRTMLYVDEALGLIVDQPDDLHQ